MPVDNPDIIDLISTKPDSKGVVLAISDHRDWNDTHTHLSALQTKISRDLAYVQSQDFQALLKCPPSGRTLLRVDRDFEQCEAG